MFDNHGITPAMAEEAFTDVMRVVIEPDYASASGRSVRTIGYSQTYGAILSIITVIHDGTVHGSNGWRSNSRDTRIYRGGDDG